jgi:hypothetical protein
MHVHRRGFSVAAARLVLGLAAPAALAQPATFVSFDNITVSNADRSDISRLADAGVVSVGEAAGGAVVTVAGEMRGRAEREGVIGVLFVPEVPFFALTFRNRRVLLAAGEVTAPVAAGESGYFVSKPKKFEVGFPAYHVYLYNTTGATATVNVYVYPTRN